MADFRCTALLIASLVASSLGAEPRVRLECGTEVQGKNLPPFGLQAFTGIRYAEPPIGEKRFSAPIDLSGCDANVAVIDATMQGSMCAQKAQAGYSLPFSIMNAFVFPFLLYLLVPLVAIFGLFTAHAVWTSSSDNAAYADLEGSDAARTPVWSKPRVQRCGLASLIPAVLMLALPGWAWSGYLGEEDCLFLNIFTPASAAPDGEPRAVMFWVHGGAYMAGSGRLDDASYGSGELEMAAEGVVHVSINYRLGAFGFLSLDDGHAESNNAGLLDQVSALRWVQRHIRSFGGDPSRVFLYGHSAGGESVMALQRMPQAKGLFHAAAALSPLAKIGATPADAAAAWRRALRPTGCDDRPCLRHLGTGALATLDVFGETAASTNFGTLPPADKDNGHKGVKFVVADDVTVLKQGWTVDVPLLVSGCREQGDFGSPDLAEAYTGVKPQAWPFTRESFGEWAAAAGLEEGDADELWPLFTGPPRQKWNQLGTDATLFCGLRSAVEQEAKSSSRASPIYLNIFKAAVPFPYLGMTEIKYAAEGIDIWLTWGDSGAPKELRNAEGYVEAKPVGEGFRASLIEMARTAKLGGAWQPFPAVCEYGADRETCSKQNVHAKACAILDKAAGRKWDIELGR